MTVKLLITFVIIVKRRTVHCKTTHCPLRTNSSLRKRTINEILMSIPSWEPHFSIENRPKIFLNSKKKSDVGQDLDLPTWHRMGVKFRCMKKPFSSILAIVHSVALKIHVMFVQGVVLSYNCFLFFWIIICR